MHVNSKRGRPGSEADNKYSHCYNSSLTDVKGMTTYDYILLQRRREKERREKEAAQSESGEQSGAAVELERDLHGRCWCLRRKVGNYKNYTRVVN